MYTHLGYPFRNLYFLASHLEDHSFLFVESKALKLDVQDHWSCLQHLTVHALHIPSKYASYPQFKSWYRMCERGYMCMAPQSIDEAASLHHATHVSQCWWAKDAKVCWLPLHSMIHKQCGDTQRRKPSMFDTPVLDHMWRANLVNHTWLVYVIS